MNMRLFSQNSNFTHALISLLVAVVLWFYAASEQSVEIALKVPLRVSPPAGRMAVLNSSLPDITLRLSVPHNMLSVVTQQAVSVYHQILAVQKAGEYSFRLEPRDVILPPGGARVLDINPEVVTVTLDEVITQKFPIRVNLEGDPAVGYAADKEGILLNPNAALIEGPKEKLGEMKEVLTSPVNVVGRNQSLRQKVFLHLDGDMRSIPKDLLTEAFIPIHKEYAVDVYRQIPVRVLGGTAQNAAVESINPAAIDFTLRGARAELDALVKEKLTAFVNIQGLAKGEHEVKVDFILPPNISLDQEKPAVKIKIK